MKEFYGTARLSVYVMHSQMVQAGILVDMLEKKPVLKQIPGLGSALLGNNYQGTGEGGCDGAKDNSVLN